MFQHYFILWFCLIHSSWRWQQLGHSLLSLFKSRLLGIARLAHMNEAKEFFFSPATTEPRPIVNTALSIYCALFSRSAAPWKCTLMHSGHLDALWTLLFWTRPGPFVCLANLLRNQGMENRTLSRFMQTYTRSLWSEGFAADKNQVRSTLFEAVACTYSLRALSL